MLLFDDTKKLEKALGEEAAAVLAHVFEKADDKLRQALATKADLHAAKADLRAEMQAVKTELIKWMMAGFLTQSALLVAILAFLR